MFLHLPTGCRRGSSAGQEHVNCYGLITRLLDDGKSTDDTGVMYRRRGFCLIRRSLDRRGCRQAGWRRYIPGSRRCQNGQAAPLYGALEICRGGLRAAPSWQVQCQNIDDGAAMRASPHGIPGLSGLSAAASAALMPVSATTRTASAAQAVVSQHVAIAGGSVEEIIEEAQICMPPESWIVAAMDSHRHGYLRALSTLKMPTKTCIPNSGRRNTQRPEAIPQAFAILSGSARKLARRLLSANFGRDADTIMCGRLFRLRAR